jgi:photosystem II stability/assembly factor-like uncharacterized protein
MPVTLMLGTTKGAFLLAGDDSRHTWTLRGPFCDGWPVNHMAADPATGTIWAAGGNDFHGAGVWRSTDHGASWTLSRLASGAIEAYLADPDFARIFGRGPAPEAPFTGRIDALWSLCLAGGTLYAGAKPAALYASRDGGATWDPVTALNDHPSRDTWSPGGAGLTLHTIVADAADPARLWVGISAAGVFATEDGGATWDRRNSRGNAPQAAHDHDHDHEGHEVGHCVHNIGHAGGDRLYQQNHHGVFRSDDGGRSWVEITAGLPSGFGFPIAVHPQDPATAWVIPLNGDTQGRYPPGASAAVWRTTDAGATWEAQREGLPGANCFFTVLRQAMTTDRAAAPGVYFGTNTGSVFASRDGGATWDEIARHLPTVLCVEAADLSAS